MNIIDLATKAMQTAIKSVVDAIKSVVDDIKAKSDTINTDVNTVKSDTSTLKSTTNTINTNVGIPTSTASKTTSANVHAKLNYLTTNMPVGVVKSVQRGYATSGVSEGTTDVNISAVNVAKSFVIVEGTGNSTNFGSPLGELKSSTLLTISGSNFLKVSWQVVEFY